MHTAQGVTADTMHGLATGSESRQQLYTMLTRGATANHVYLEVVGDGDPHSVIHPTLVRPLTPTDILESMLARDDAQRSATSLLREQADPATRLGEAAQRYLDSLYVAAEDARSVADVVDGPRQHRRPALLPGLADEAAWPTLRAHLLLLGAAGENPVEALRAAAERPGTGHRRRDRAAVLDWRLDASGLRNAGDRPAAVDARHPGPPGRRPALGRLPRPARAPGRPARRRGPRPGRRHRPSLPTWAQNGIRPDAATVADVEVWRAAMQVPADDRRPTGAPQLQKASSTYQRRLNRRVTGDHTPALKEWRQLLYSLAPQVRGDEFTPLLAERLAAMSRAGVHAHQLLRTAADGRRPLPDEHAAAALWWRMARHLSPAVAAQIGDGSHGEGVTTSWAAQLPDLLGAERAARIQASTWWPALVSNIDHGLQRGWQLEALLARRVRALPSDGWDGVDECQALVWRTSIALEPIPDEHAHDYHFDEPPADMWDGVEPDPATFVDHPDDIDWPLPTTSRPTPSTWSTRPTSSTVDVAPPAAGDVDEEQYVEGDLTLAG